MVGAVAEGAQAAGGRVVGIIPQHLEALEAGNRTASEYLVVNSMHARKQLMAARSDAFCALPGGLGTLDDTFEIITWRQLKLHDKPVLLVYLDGYVYTPIGLASCRESVCSSVYVSVVTCSLIKYTLLLATP